MPEERRGRPNATTLPRDDLPTEGVVASIYVGSGLALDSDRYVIGEVLGEGGMGEVRRCHDRAAARDVALKATRAGPNVDVERRFLREARVQARLAHPAIVPVYDVGHDKNGRAYFTMKRVEGVTLDDVVQLLRRGDEQAAREYGRHRLLTAFARVCLAVDYAHARGVLHRDLKPANVMLGAFGEVYVLDWGLAKIDGRGEELENGTAASGPETETGRTERGITMGTPAYMAPEQAAARPLDVRADVFSLGAILFEILTLEQLLGDEQIRASRERRATSFEARPSVRAPSRGVPVELDEICMRATALDAADRYPSARALHEAVEAVLSDDEEQARRVRLAAAHLERARALSRPGAADELRPAALEELGSALALAPEDVEARRHLLDLLNNPPKETPEDVKVRRLQNEGARLRRMRRLVAMIYAVCWTVAYPIIAIVGGVRSLSGALLVPAVWIGTALLILSVYPSADQARRDEHRAHVIIAGAVALATTSVLLGPLFVLPGLAVAVVFGHILLASKSQRLLTVALTCLALAISAYLAFARILDVYTPIGTDGFSIHGALDSSRNSFFFGLTLCHLAQVVFGASFAAKYRDVLDARVFENALFSWQLSNLVPRAGVRRPRPSMSGMDEGPLESADEAALAPRIVPNSAHEAETRYMRVERITTTTTSEIWRCVDRRFGRELEMHVARRPEDDDAVRTQAKLRGCLEHPAIAPLYDVGVTEDGRAFFTAKYVRGVCLDVLLTDARESRDSRQVGDGRKVAPRDGAPLKGASRERSLRRILAAFAQVCLAVAYAHERNVFHGRITNRSIVLGSFGEVYIEGFTKGDAASDVKQLGAVLRSVLDEFSASVPELDALCERVKTVGPAVPSARAINETIEAFLSGERDAAVRRELARTHLELARTAVERAFGESASFEVQADARVEALREIGRAVRLEPEEPEAIRLLFRLLTEPSPHPPPEVVRQVEQFGDVRARGAAIANLLFGALWLLLYPAVALLLGVRQLGPVIVVWGSWALAEVTILLSLTRPNASSAPWPMLTSMLAAMMTTAITGPFFVTPVMATMGAMGFVLVVGRRWRFATIGLGALVILLPTALAWTRVFQTIDLEGSAIVVVNGALGAPTPRTMYLVLTVGHILAVLFAAEYAARFRDRLDAVETKLLVRTWQLTKLFPQKKMTQAPGVRSTGSPGQQT